MSREKEETKETNGYTYMRERRKNRECITVVRHSVLCKTKQEQEQLSFKPLVTETVSEFGDEN